jgi:hypothetical protein
MDRINMNAGQRLEHAPGTAPQQSWRTEMQAKSTPSIPRVCEYCGGSFRTWPYVIANGNGRFCSRGCGKKANPSQPGTPRPLLPHPEDPTALLVPLTRGCFAVIDASDAPLVSSYLWSTLKTKGRVYAHRRVGTDAAGKQQFVLMHVAIFGSPNLDHKDADGLNNRRSNLRQCDQTLNQANSRRKPNRAGYRGVIPTESGKWSARVTCRGVNYGLGTFDSPELAAQAYDDKAREMFGEFARLNFPMEGEEAA